MAQSWAIGDWLQRAGELTVSRWFLQSVLLQLVLIAGVAGLAAVIRLVSCGFTDRAVERFERLAHAGRRFHELRGVVVFLYAWLLLVVVGRVAARFGADLEVVGIAATLAALWIVLRASTLVLRDPALARLVAAAAWIVAALDITGLLSPTTAALDSAALTIGTFRLSLLLVVKSALVIAVLLWVALALARVIGGRLQRLTGLSPSVQALTANLVKIALVALALVVGLNTVGIDLTAFTVFGGAVGVGLGFGLQKIVSNFVSGIILLLERSIKPGDVIEVGHTYGLVTSLGARYASVSGRDGKEYLIPNETLITNQVTNWSYSTSLLRLDVTFGVAYDSDLRQVRALAVAAAQQTRRVLAVPAPVCHITQFADNGVELLLRFWIEDPANGVKNVTGDVYLALWDALHEHGVELPYPQREIRIRDASAGLLGRPSARSAAQ